MNPEILKSQLTELRLLTAAREIETVLKTTGFQG